MSNDGKLLRSAIFYQLHRLRDLAEAEKYQDELVDRDQIEAGGRRQLTEGGQDGSGPGEEPVLRLTEGSGGG